MGKLYVVRHGETDFNVLGRYSGSTDIELNEKGKQQARTMAESFDNISIDIIVSSTMKRAQQTACIIGEHLGKPIVVMEEFVERNVGVYEGLTRDEVKEKYPELWNQDVLRQFDCMLHKGESVRQVRDRVKRGLYYILNNYKDKNIVLVTHGYISREIYGYFNNVSQEDFNKFAMSNCQVVEYCFE